MDYAYAYPLQSCCHNADSAAVFLYPASLKGSAIHIECATGKIYTAAIFGRTGLNGATGHLKCTAGEIDTAAIFDCSTTLKAAIATKAIPYCNVVLITGEEMEQKVTSYLTVLHNANPQAVGGKLPDTSIFYK